MTHREKLSGVFPPVMTPFSGQALCLDALRENILKLNETPLRGYMPLGSNGEFQSLSDEEALEVLQTVFRAASPDKTRIAGAARESAYQTVEFSKRCADLGAEYVSILAPHYFASKMTDDALKRYYVYVADRCPVPVLLYNAPGFSAGVTLSAELIGELATHPNIVGMKDTSQLDIGIYTQAAPPNAEFYVLAGTIRKFYDGLTKGAIGGVLSMANYLPELCCALQRLYEAGDVDGAGAMSDRLCRLNAATSGRDGVAGVKASMDICGYRGLEPRLPLCPLPEAQRASIRDALRKEGVL